MIIVGRTLEVKEVEGAEQPTWRVISYQIQKNYGGLISMAIENIHESTNLEYLADKIIIESATQKFVDSLNAIRKKQGKRLVR